MQGHCLFCRIAEGEVPAHVVYRDDAIMAFLDIGPIRPGHVQIIPRRHFETFDDLPAEVANAIIALGQRIAKVQKALFDVARVGFLFTGGDVPHAHAHVVPMVRGDDITSRRYIQEERVTYRGLPNPGYEALAEMATTLRQKLDRA